MFKNPFQSCLDICRNLSWCSLESFVSVFTCVVQTVNQLWRPTIILWVNCISCMDMSWQLRFQALKAADVMLCFISHIVFVSGSVTMFVRSWRTPGQKARKESWNDSCSLCMKGQSYQGSRSFAGWIFVFGVFLLMWKKMKQRETHLWDVHQFTSPQSGYSYRT